MALDVTLQVMRLVMANTVFLISCLLLLIPLSRFKPATFAVMKRNLFGYFNNPTGYVFICLFVIVGSAFAFWPHEFFNSNLATLGELNKNFPLVMLLFIPTITMSIWSEERRQGTDELLLTIPATDWDVVLGKYLAVASIFTTSLVFSQIANFTVLNILALGDIDTGLFATTYLGYWLIGLAMLALGMAASFLTKNLTVGFVLGVIFNAPLVLAANADLILRTSEAAQLVSYWSYASQFEDFGRGVISFRPIFFFLMIVAIGLYLSIILIGRRHWYGGQGSVSKLWHFVLRACSLAVIAVGLNLYFSSLSLFRVDMTIEQVSSLSDETKQLLDTLDPSRTIQIEAFISKSVPEQYARLKLDLIAMLREFAARGGRSIDVKIHDNLEPFSDAAIRADEQYGIQPETVRTIDRGTLKQEKIFLGAAFQRGSEKVIVPFFDQGIPVEYELIRSVNTVAQARRPRIGVVKTRVQLFGGVGFQGPFARELIIEEMEKQYEVVQVSPDEPYDRFDVLLVAQPSSLTPPQLEHLINAIRAGQPTALFEDPFPNFFFNRGVPATAQPNPAVGGEQAPKCDITRLWGMLGIDALGEIGDAGLYDSQVVFQRWNPYPKARGITLTDESVFASPAATGARLEAAISTQDHITSGLNQLLFPYPGAIRHDDTKGMDFEILVETGQDTGTITFQEIVQASIQSEQLAQADFNTLLDQVRRNTGVRYCLAARISGRVQNEVVPGLNLPMQGAPGKSGDEPINVVYVADIDFLASTFVVIRAKPNVTDVNWQFDNVPFMLNVLDSLAGSSDDELKPTTDRLIEIRKRQPRHSTLQMIDRATEQSRDNFANALEQFEQQFAAAEAGANAEMQKEIEQITGEIQLAEQEGRQVDVQRLRTELQVNSKIWQGRKDAQLAKIRNERDRQHTQIERELNQRILSVQNFYKTLAVLLPPIPPLLVGLIVYRRRRQRELEGVIDERLR